MNKHTEEPLYLAHTTKQISCVATLTQVMQQLKKSQNKIVRNSMS